MEYQRALDVYSCAVENCITWGKPGQDFIDRTYENMVNKYNNLPDEIKKITKLPERVIATDTVFSKYVDGFGSPIY